MESLEALGINGPSLLLHAVNFLLVLALLTRFLYKPVIKVLDDRAARIKESMDRAEDVKKEFALAEEQVRLSLEAARREGQAIVDQASKIAEQVRGQARQEAQADADKIVAKARAQLDQERQRVVTELRQQMADLVVAAAGKVIAQSMDDRSQRQLVEEFLQSDAKKLND